MNPQELVLKVGASLVLIFGVLIWLGAHPATLAIPAFFGDLVFWPLDAMQTSTTQEARLLSAIGGGIMVGWGFMLWALAGEGMRLAPAFARRVILTSVWAWFGFDSLGSIIAGAPLNLAGNIVFLALFTLPFTGFLLGREASSADAN